MSTQHLIHAAAVERIAAAVTAHRYRYKNEIQLHEALAEVLAKSGITAVPEVQLSGHDRIDFLAGAVGIEVKVAGTPAEVARQLRRYSASPLVEALVLVTNRARHRSVPREIGGKPVMVVTLPGVTG